VIGLVVIEAPAFKGYPLSKIGDALDSKIIISKKKVPAETGT